jgi:outer membrane protein assembly factor BamE
MKQTRFALLIPALAALVATSGCSSTKIPSPADLPIVYKIDVQQGNEVTQDMLAQLKPGMERAKVRFIMGTPLVVDTFHNDRWDYVFTMQKRGGERVQRRVSLYFRDDKLDRVAGDVKPAAGAIATSADRASKTIEVPPAEKGLFTRVSETVSGDDEKKTDADAEKNGGAASETGETSQAGTASNDGSGSGETTPSDETAASSDGASEFVIDNATDTEGSDSTADANADDDTTAPAEQPAAGGTLMPTFQSESDLDDAVLRDSGDVAAEAASGSDADQPTTDNAESGSASGGTGQSAVTVPDDAPAPRNKKGFFGRLLEKVGVGDNEDGEYQSADPTHRDVSDPENQ